MNTEEELERITDRGKFERLVTLVLRKDNRDYAAILETGTNAKGETIRSPVDGFCRVPGSCPPRFLLVEHTTTDTRGLKGLEEKWLADPSIAKKTRRIKKAEPKEEKEGDLLKAARVAQNLKNNFSNAKFTVILTTNLRLNLELRIKVEKKAEELGVDVDFWDQSRIAGFLDTEPEGQWLRKKYLGIHAEMLSESLLGTLCEQSLANYEKQFLTSPNSWVSREIESQIEKGTHTNTYTIQLLIGESGSGKSAAAYQILKKHLGSGGYGLWVSDELLRNFTSLETALDRVLRDLYPSLLPDAGRVALGLIPQGSRLLLIVDDVNRANNPTTQVENLVNWSKPEQSEPSDSPSSFSPYLVVCPVWPQILGSISRDLKETTWVNNVLISSMTSAEGMVAVQTTTSDAGMEITNTEAISLATSLGNDPILIGLFASLLSSTQPCELNSLTENVVERFIKTTIKQVSSSPGTLLEIEYRDALSTLTTFMLKNRRLFPLWKEIRDWFRESPDELTALRELTRHEKLCRLNVEKKLVFRHDRIQQALLVESMIELLAEISSDSKILYEPFYAEIIGRAIARSPQSRVFLKELRNQLPLALVEAIRCFGTPTTEYHQAIIEEVKEWQHRNLATGSITESVLDAVCWSLVEINSPTILEITNALLEVTTAFFKQRPVLLACLRNGCAVSAVHYFIHENRRYFAPFTGDSLRDQSLEQAKRYHKEKLLGELKQLLVSDAATDEEREGTLSLAGFLGFTELEDEIVTCWELVTQKTRVLPTAIWAAVHCCGATPKKLLDPLIGYWAELPDERNDYGISFKNWFVDRLRRSLVRGIRDDVIHYLIKQCRVHESLRWYITRLCDLIDAPDAIEFTVRSVAAFERGIAGTDKISTWSLELPDNWDDSKGSNRKLSQASIERLKSLWEDPTNDSFEVTFAFRLWLTGIESEQIDLLKAIPPDAPFFKNVLQKRMELGDQSVVKEISTLLATEIHWFYWFQFAHHVWCDELLAMTQARLEAFKESIPTDFSCGGLYEPFEHSILSKLLTLIPVKDAEMLLEMYWGYLGYSHAFIQTALYVGTSRCLELAASSISRCPNDIPVFEFVGNTFGCFDSERQKYLTIQHLERLLPYLDRLDEDTLGTLAQACRQMGIPEWSQKYLSSRLSEQDRKLYHPSDDHLLQDLDEFAADKHGVWRVTHWLEGFDKRHDPKSRALSIVDFWLQLNPTVRGLQIAAACIQSEGTRKDLSILDQYTIEGSPDEIAKIKENTRFAVYRRSLD